MENKETLTESLKQSRKDFCKVVQKYYVSEHLELRTAVDSFLIAFDNACNELPETDLEAFISLYKRLGIELEIHKDHEDNQYFKLCGSKIGSDTEDYVFSSKLHGFTGFYTCCLFDSNGKFISQGFYE